MKLVSLTWLPWRRCVNAVLGRVARLGGRGRLVPLMST